MLLARTEMHLIVMRGKDILKRKHYKVQQYIDYVLIVYSFSNNS